MTRHFSVAAALLCTVADAAQANDLLGRPEYGPLNLTRSIGYHDHARSDGSWSIEARSTRMQRSGYASEMALYRAAEVATQQGHAFFQVLRSEAMIGTGMMNRNDEDVSLIVRFVDNGAEPETCLQRGKHPGRCYTAEAARVLARLEPRIRDASWRRDRDLDRSIPTTVSDNSGVTRVTTLFRFDVTERGTVENCSLVESNAPAALNASGCRTFSTMAHFTPAVDASGKTIRATKTIRVVWQSSDLGGPTTMIPLKDAPTERAASPAPVVAALPAPKPVSAMPPVAAAKRAFPKDDTVEVVLD